MAAFRRPTLRDVAAEAGVSFKTVSRVVNGEGGVSSDLMSRVEEAVASLGYRPDDRARQLRQSVTQAATIGFVLVDVANPFFSSLLRGIEDVASAHGCLVLAGSTDSSVERERQLIESFVGRRVDGLIIVPSGKSGSLLRSEVDRGTPVVFLDLETDTSDADLVRSDHFQGAFNATKHLLSFGHKDLAYLGDDPAIFSARLRLEGFTEAMRQAGRKVPRNRVITGSRTEDEWYQIAVELLGRARRPTAAFTAQNFTTIGTVRALHELKLQHVFGLVGFDDIELADVVDPGISVIPQRPRDLGRRAAELLLDRIGGNARPWIREVIDNPLIERGSGEIPR